MDSYATVHGDFKENNDCVVRSFAFGSGRPYQEIHALCKEHGRKDFQGTFDFTTHAVAKELNLVPVINIPDANCYRTMTLKKFLQKFPKGTYYVRKKGHAFVIKDGEVHNWKPLGGSTRITLAYRFEKEEPKVEVKIDGSKVDYRGFSLTKVKHGWYTCRVIGDKALPSDEMKKSIDGIFRKFVMEFKMSHRQVVELFKEEF